MPVDLELTPKQKRPAGEPCCEPVVYPDVEREAAERIAADNAAHPDRIPIRYGIGLHLGQVTYGNIGVPERLEFTVIGSAANTAARVESMTKTLGKNIVISAAFADNYAGKLESLGKHKLKDVEGDQELFTIA